MKNLHGKVAKKFRHGQFRLNYHGRGKWDIKGVGPYEGEHMGTISDKWPYRIKKTPWWERGRK